MSTTVKWKENPPRPKYYHFVFINPSTAEIELDFTIEPAWCEPFPNRHALINQSTGKIEKFGSVGVCKRYFERVYGPVIEQITEQYWDDEFRNSTTPRRTICPNSH